MRIAVIGAGISGLTAALHLQERHHVVLLEAGNYAGGHTHTHQVLLDGRVRAVDSGFIVFNTRTYPHFCRLLAELRVPSQPTDMSFSVRCDRTGLEYAGTGINGLFAQRRNLLKPRFYRLLADWFRFNRQATRLLNDLEEFDEELTIGEFFERHPYSATFRDCYFLPLGSAVWSSPRQAFEQFPIRFVLEFYRNHGMLGLPGQVPWQVVRGGSRQYVEAILQRLRTPVRLNSPIVAVRRRHRKMHVHAVGRGMQVFDHVIFACHSDQALKMLGESATTVERELLSAFPYQSNTALLHTDDSVMPRCRRAWASWNYHLPADNSDAATVTYDMTRLQRLGTKQRVFVTLNADERIHPDRVLQRMVYHHPVFTAGCGAAQRRHPQLLDHQGASFCGAYWGSGFHEDGVVSALAVCRALLLPVAKFVPVLALQPSPS
ncbi:MAG: FAD-dependent oxidoreductase [Pirellulaceae bacterium]|nr:FAD-dependent oxidoreductase [Pirellulaceae bacterium]